MLALCVIAHSFLASPSAPRGCEAARLILAPRPEVDIVVLVFNAASSRYFEEDKDPEMSEIATESVTVEDLNNMLNLWLTFGLVQVASPFAFSLFPICLTI